MIAVLFALVITPPVELRNPRTRVSLNPEKRHSHAPLITGDTFRSFCPFIIDETGLLFDSDQVRPGDAIFVGMHYLDYFFREIFPSIEVPFVLVTSNGDGAVDERYRTWIESPKIIAWFGRNMTLRHPKAHIIPLGFCWHSACKDPEYHAILTKRLREFDPDAYFRPKQIPIYCSILRTSHPTRQAVFDHCRTLPGALCTGNVPFRRYIQDLARSRFVISPRGVNIDCFRTWEALLVGSIPVIQSEGIDALYDDLPVIIVEDLTKVTFEELEREYERLRVKVFDFRKLTVSYWFDQIRDAKNKLIQIEH